MTRRDALKALAAMGLAAALPCMPGALLRVARAESPQTPFLRDAGTRLFRNMCPANCYDTCAMLSHVVNGRLEYVEGDPLCSYTNGCLCVKGYAYPRRVYSPDRIRYPMMQNGRNTGRWSRISWDEALERIAAKICNLKRIDGSLLGLALSKYSGNLSILNYAVEGLMSSLGHVTMPQGNPCWSAGLDAQNYDFGKMWCNDPEDLVQAKTIIVWGANPAWCSVHTMRLLLEAQANGAFLMVIDPQFTQTAAKADLYIQVKPGTDAALALGMARHLLDLGLYDKDFVRDHAHGFAEFAEYLRNEVTVQWASSVCEVPEHEIRNMAELFGSVKPATIWMGYGMQRYSNGGAMIRTIDALVAMTGNIGRPGGGARYGQLETWDFSYQTMNQQPPPGSIGVPGVDPQTGAARQLNRYYNINTTARSLMRLTDPPVRMLWVAGRNPLAQDPDHAAMLDLFKQLELVVCVEQFFTETVRHADIVLPVTTLFEEWSIGVSYWHYWLGINQQAIAPLHECKSNLEIAAALSQVMNRLEPGSCTFPQQADPEAWLDRECSAATCTLFGIKGWRDLLEGPAKADMVATLAWHRGQFATPSGRYEFRSERCRARQLPELPVFVPARLPSRDLHLITPHVQFGIHSQFIHLDWMEAVYPEPLVYLHPQTAYNHGIKPGDPVRVFNDTGELMAKACVLLSVPRDTVVLYETWFRKLAYNVQNLVDDSLADMGDLATGMLGAATHDQFVDIERVNIDGMQGTSS